MQSLKRISLAVTCAIALQSSTIAFSIHESADSAFLQSLVTTGRLQYDYSYFDEDVAGSEDETKWRRARAGFKAKMFNKLTVHAEINMDLENHDPIYNGLTDANISWTINDNWKVKIGKQGAAFTQDGSTSSKKLIAIERSKLSENIWFTREYFTGITFSGKRGKWSYNYGLFSNDTSKEFENVADEEYFILLSGGYNFSEDLDVDHASIQFDFVHNEESNNVGTKSLETVLSVSGKYDDGKIHFWGDISYAKAFNGGDIYGLQLMPFYDINEMFQIVGRYTYVNGSKDNSLGLSRYEKDIVSGKGDSLQEFYLGLNTYFKGHKLKWQNGIQFTEMKDAAKDGGEYSGIGFTSALRFYW
jgi:phosphate-selective porin OprO/OprP